MLDAKVKELALKLARVGGEKMLEGMRRHSDLEIHSKGCDDLVTEIDIWIEEHMVREIQEAFPSHAIVGEEGVFEDDSSRAKVSSLLEQDICWVIDPLDGTANFANRIPHCCVSIGILQKGKPEFGIVYDPFRDELFQATMGEGATLNGKPIKVSKERTTTRSIVGMGLPTDVKEQWDTYKELYQAAVLNFQKVRLLGSTALELCWTACGRLDGFVQYHAKAWDLAAGVLIVNESQGVTSNFNPAAEFDLLGESVIACAPQLEAPFREMLQLDKTHSA
jgi:myo-inositol-1(or 4)-monophosphatase